MNFFMDAAEIGEIKGLMDFGYLGGATANPSLVAKFGRNFKGVIAEIGTLTESDPKPDC